MTSITAVIPVFNGETYVADAIRSVLSQTVGAVECIVVDDGSTDGTQRVLEHFRGDISVLHQANAGVSAARNLGAKQANGEFVAFLDHDDEWLPEKLERQLAALGPDDSMVVCALQVVAADGASGEVKHLGPVDQLVNGMLMFDGTPTVSCSSSGLMRRDDFLAMGGFDTSLSMSADWDLMLRVLLEGRLAYVDEPLVRYRVHDGNMSRRVDLIDSDMRRAFAKAFEHPALAPDVKGRRREAYARLHRMLAGSYRDAGQSRRALGAALQALRYTPSLLADLVMSAAKQRRG
jgi:glycosyltransferase involved in cell wall biosynthesis